MNTFTLEIEKAPPKPERRGGYKVLEVRIRQAVERIIISRLVDELLASGYKIQVHNGEDVECDYTVDKVAIMKALFTTDEDVLNVVHKDGPGTESFVHLVYGNSGCDVMSDYGVSLEAVVAPVYAWIDEVIGD